MSTYKFKYRRKFFWTSFQVTGHDYNKELNKMILYFEDGGIREICQWHLCEVKLGIDWLAVRKKQMEVAAGQAIPLAVKD